jgi:predicted DCC family thiol-disulfide oxidoreductase YuxK
MGKGEAMPAKTQTRTTAIATEPVERPVVFFDGVCGLCNATVDFFLKRDRRGQFLFAPLQGETAQERLDARDTEQLGSVILQVNGRTYRRSSAVTRMLWRLGGFWSFAGGLLWLIPWPIRELGYQLVAAFRYRLFGRKDSCRMPTPEERGRFLP